MNVLAQALDLYKHNKTKKMMMMVTMMMRMMMTTTNRIEKQE